MTGVPIFPPSLIWIQAMPSSDPRLQIFQTPETHGQRLESIPLLALSRKRLGKNSRPFSSHHFPPSADEPCCSSPQILMPHCAQEPQPKEATEISILTLFN